MGNSREPIRSQTSETFNTGNLTAPYTSSEGGFITPEEFNADFRFESQAMNVGWTYDPTSPVTNAYTACNVGNNRGSIYCATGQFNLENISIGPGQRLVGGKYTLYISMKDAATATNTETMSVFFGIVAASRRATTSLSPTPGLRLRPRSFRTPIDLTHGSGAGLRAGHEILGGHDRGPDPGWLCGFRSGG